MKLIIKNEKREHPIESFNEASLICRKVIHSAKIKKSQWLGSVLLNSSNKEIGHVSYGGTVWNMELDIVYSV